MSVGHPVTTRPVGRPAEHANRTGIGSRAARTAATRSSCRGMGSATSTGVNEPSTPNRIIGWVSKRGAAPLPNHVMASAGLPCRGRHPAWIQTPSSVSQPASRAPPPSDAPAPAIRRTASARAGFGANNARRTNPTIPQAAHHHQDGDQPLREKLRRHGAPDGSFLAQTHPGGAACCASGDGNTAASVHTCVSATDRKSDTLIRPF